MLTLGLLLHDYPRLKFIFYPPADAPALRRQALATAPLPMELLWWLGAGIFVVGSLLYPVSLRTMTGTMLFDATLLLGATAWHYYRKRQARGQ